MMGVDPPKPEGAFLPGRVADGFFQPSVVAPLNDSMFGANFAGQGRVTVEVIGAQNRSRLYELLKPIENLSFRALFQHLVQMMVIPVYASKNRNLLPGKTRQQRAGAPVTGRPGFRRLAALPPPMPLETSEEKLLIGFGDAAKAIRSGGRKSLEEAMPPPESGVPANADPRGGDFRKR